MDNIILTIIIVLLASILQTCTGFGFSIMATPFLLLVYDAHVAIQINIILSIVISVLVVPRILQDIDKDLMKRLIKGSVAGVPVGLLIYLYMNVQMLTMLVSIVILVLTVLLMMKVRTQPSTKKDYSTGGLSGVLTSSLGMPGPPLLLYFTGTSKNKDVLRSTTLAFYLFIYSVALIMQIGFGSTTQEIWLHSLILIPAAFGGMFIGQWVFRFISQRIFRIMTYIILSFTGIYLLIDSIIHLL